MSKIAALGRKLTNPPVVYVLAQVRFNAILSMEKFIPEIQEQFRKIYPKFQKGVTQSLHIGADGQPKESIQVHRWEFSNKEQTTGFVLQVDSFVFHTSDYENFESFLSQLSDALSVINKILDIDLIERLGLRYIDVIAPNGGKTLNDYLNPGIAGLPYEELDVELTVSFYETVTKSDLGKLVLRTLKNFDAVNMPQDLFPVNLKLKNPATKGNLSALLDSDHYIEKTMDYDLNEIQNYFSKLQALISKSFWSAITEVAVNKWR
jgi:uncharacterized protein (TIGR04255 family)